ncbi:RDD family protein [Sulfurimonas sp. SAG-AH-194-C21]|nr:RDD family protein [Sulfurimonas sp. SAG-AH-194-C21]MDF1883885.1 RDD family protein [Sulfurimonas sp. SAG-AH-194-C21]
MKKNTQVFKHAPYPLKVKALITDMFMIYAPILYITTYVIMDGKESFQSSQLAPLVAVTLYGVIYALFISKLAQTPGKKAYSLKILDVNSGKNISFIRAFLRFIVFLFSATIVIGIFFPLYRKDKKSLHDILCGTIEVVEKERD